MSAIALLIRRLRTERGGTASVSQAEVMLAHSGSDVVRISGGEYPGQTPDWPWSAYRADGDDDWCVVTVREDDDWRALRQAIGFEGGASFDTREARLRERHTIDTAISTWMSQRGAGEAMQLLQAAGVPAARMLRLVDLPDFEYFRERRFFRVERHPWLREPVVVERAAVPDDAIPEPACQPAPLMAEQTGEIVRDWLGLEEVEIARLCAAGVLELVDPSTLAAARDAVADNKVA